MLNWNSEKSRQRMTKNMFFDWSILPSGVETMFLLSSICRVELGPFLVNLFDIDFVISSFFALIFVFILNTEKHQKIKEETMGLFSCSWNCLYICKLKATLLRGSCHRWISDLCHRPLWIFHFKHIFTLNISFYVKYHIQISFNIHHLKCLNISIVLKLPPWCLECQDCRRYRHAHRAKRRKIYL